jgi:large subunit ribosomal protein L1
MNKGLKQWEGLRVRLHHRKKQHGNQTQQTIRSRRQAGRQDEGLHVGRGGETSQARSPPPRATRRSISRSSWASIRSRATRWCAAPSRFPAGSGKNVRVLVFAKGAAADAGQGRRRRVRRLRGPDQEGHRRLPGFRRRRGDAGSDGRSPQAGPCARTAWLDAESQDRNGHRRHREGGQGVQSRSRRVQARQGREPARPCGKFSFTPADLEANGRAVIEAIVRSRPATAKGRFIETVTLSSTYSPGIRVDIAPFLSA